MSGQRWVPATAVLLIGFTAGAIAIRGVGNAAHAAETLRPASPDDVSALKAEVARLKETATDQSHVMSDVGYHYSNLWFAGQNANWPLAQFYFDETHSHLRWAVRVIPVRKDNAGREVDLRAILQALEQTSLKDVDDAIKSKDKTKFTQTYKVQLENCMACHRAASKEYIRLHVPERPDANIIDFAAQDAAK
ncbi:MAG: hypothetical protein QOF78_3759 [Phycisphaerales bacterium]|nr:hypothetical protein [Phycisphaerales bacterium]